MRNRPKPRPDHLIRLQRQEQTSIRDALKIEERDYREIEGTGLAVAR